MVNRWRPMSRVSEDHDGTNDGTVSSRLRRARLELTGDLAVLAVFVLGGLAEHRSGLTLGTFLRNALPFGGAWLAWSKVFGCYRQVEDGRRIGALVSTWLLAVPTGVGVRAFLLGRSFDGTQGRFLLVAMATTAVMLVLWRGALAGLDKILGKRPEEGGRGVRGNGERSNQRILEA